MRGSSIFRKTFRARFNLLEYLPFFSHITKIYIYKSTIIACPFSDEKNGMRSSDKMQKRINGLLKVFCCGSMREAKKGSSSEQPLVLSTSVSGSQDTVFETCENKTNLSDKDKNSAWLSQKKWHEVQRGLRQTVESTIK